MKRYYKSEETFVEFNPERFYAGKIDGVVVLLQCIEYESYLYHWVDCVQYVLNSFSGSGEGLEAHEIFSTFTELVDCECEFYEFETAKKMYQWIADNL